MLMDVIKKIFKSRRSTPANQCDYQEILRPKKQSEKPPMTVTTITGLLLQSTTDAYDARDLGIQAGLITPEMSTAQAIASPLAFYVFSGFEAKFSPKIALSFLDNYCLPEIKEHFKAFYILYAQHAGLEFSMKDFESHEDFDTDMDIEGLSMDGDRLNLKAENNPFKEPYRSIWIKNLS